jgi:3-methyladenine DNA glycosylase AlkC
MAQSLKQFFNTALVKTLATQLHAAYPTLAKAAFIQQASRGLEALELMPRAQQIAAAMANYLPADYVQAIRIIRASLGAPLPQTDNNGMAPFFYLPHVFFVRDYGLAHLEESLQAQYELTQRFTAEFSIRPFIERYPEQTLARLAQWSQDANVHVRRLVSEGTRPRLPWAPVLRPFVSDPRPALALLEALKDDPELYVRRSVANHLNDIGKDHPDILYSLCRRWKKGAPPERLWVIKHALRFAIKQGDPQALALMGFAQQPQVSLQKIRIFPKKPVWQSSVSLSCCLENTAAAAQDLLVDLQVNYASAKGQARKKVFKLKALKLQPGESWQLQKSLSLANLSTRKHHPGLHSLALLINGQTFELGQFHLQGPTQP